MPREVAMAQYVDEVAKLHPAFASRLVSREAFRFIIFVNLKY